MLRKLATRYLLGAWLATALPALGANEMRIARTAILSATLPAGTNWQVQSRTGPSGAWVGTGVLVPGRGSPAMVRMEGFPGEAAYRFQRIDGGATVAPTLANAWDLAGTAPGENQVLIQSSANLVDWSQAALVFPDLEGRYGKALPTPLAARGFFRSEVPALATDDASATSHSAVPPYDGAAGFGPVYDDMPQIFKDGFIGALAPAEYHRGGQNAAAAGECFELAGPYGRTTVIISNLTDAPPGTVDVGRSFFDLGPEAFKVLSGGSGSGAVTAGVRLVPAPVTGNVKLLVPTSSSPYYVELRPYNYRAGVSKVEILNSGSSTWLNLPRSQFNSFVFSGGGSTPQLLFPVQVRVTSRFGEVVSFPPIASLTSNQRITGLAQFTVFPELAPVPEHRVRPAYHDALTKVPGDTWSAGGFSGATVTEVDSSVAYAGTASLRISGLSGFSGVTFSNYPAFTRPQNAMLKLAIRSASPIAASQVGLWIYGSNTLGGPQVSSSYILLPPLTTGWQVFRFPLEASGAPPVIWGFGISDAVSAALPNVWLDEVEVLHY